MADDNKPSKQESFFYHREETVEYHSSGDGESLISSFLEIFIGSSSDE